ncbi:hypothetical protein ACFWA4_17855 [Streptomyces sp. NPDC060011]|uniref:hypothetical protein n=1 Tax=unclassified Streptomyces TaxID=2593676 RepID=UPI0013B7823F|nr:MULTISPECIES: hypothetical protein [unclassified Streptomyces]MCX5281209.1 hypothetical protein [Streptomyces sp. NBC_00198]NEB34846.1 hypothetical protein [Streptomyces sp. SID14446]WSD75606.1 hypothetical protein OHB33_04410 [Streptomyces sp. NBC_01558]
MTMWHQDRPVTVSVRPAGADWLNGAEGDCRWCCALGAPERTERVTSTAPSCAEPAAAPAVEPVTDGRTERAATVPTSGAAPALTHVYGWIERTRVVMVPVAMITVLAALTLVAMG